jgi:hypothetical protein
LGKLTSIVFGLLIATGFGANAAEIKTLTARAGATVLEKIDPEFERATSIKLNDPLPPDMQYQIQFVAGINTESRTPAAARDLLKFFAAPASSVIKSQGMEPA